MRINKAIQQFIKVSNPQKGLRYFFIPNNLITSERIRALRTTVAGVEVPTTVNLGGISYTTFTASMLSKVLISLFNKNNEKVIDRMPAYTLASVLNTGRLKGFDIDIDISKSYIELVDTTGIPANSVFMLEFLISPKNDGNYIRISRVPREANKKQGHSCVRNCRC